MVGFARAFSSVLRCALAFTERRTGVPARKYRADRQCARSFEEGSKSQDRAVRRSLRSIPSNIQRDLPQCRLRTHHGQPERRCLDSAVACHCLHARRCGHGPGLRLRVPFVSDAPAVLRDRGSPRCGLSHRCFGGQFRRTAHRTHRPGSWHGYAHTHRDEHHARDRTA